MSDTNTTSRLITLAAKKFKTSSEQLGPEDDFFAALGIDSVQALELLSDLEIEFDVEVPDYELQGVKTFAALARVIDDRR
jgi:acyl carrier protein